MNRKDIIYQHMIAFSGTDGLINDTSCKFLITEEKDSNENGYDLKNIISDQPLKQGDYITIDNILHMIIDIKKVTNSSYTFGTFRKALKITLESNLKDVYAIVDKVKGVYAQGQQITEVHDEYTFVVPKSVCNYTSLNIGTNMIVYAGGSYDIISIDDSKEGILTITGRFNNIYNPHVYTITLNEVSKTIVESENYTILATCTDNGVLVPSPSLAYVSNDTNIATVDLSGIISALKAGTCNITVNYQNVSATIALKVNVKPVTPVISYTENWSQTTSIKQYVTSTYTVTRSTNGVIENPLIDYVLDSAGIALGSKITVTRKADNSFSVKNNTITSTTTCHVSITDHASGYVIANQLLTFVAGM